MLDRNICVFALTFWMHSQCLLASFGSKVRFAFARVSTYCREVLRVAMHGYGGERKYYVSVL